jgi:hypothetical protein
MPDDRSLPAMAPRTSPRDGDSYPIAQSRVRRWLREPLVHFLLAGLALFGLYGWLEPAAFEQPSDRQIVITPDDLRQLSLVWLAQGRPPPSADELASLVEAKVREEVLYREALALGLDREDTIVKRRMAQKMDFIADDLASLQEPSRKELETWFEANAERFARPPRVSFRHIYFAPDRRHAQARDDAVRALESLGGKGADAAATAGLGDRFMFQSYYPDRSLDQIAKDFGPRFAQALVAEAPGAWHGPIESGFGWHLVWIDEMTPRRIPAFGDIEPEVREAWTADRREEMKRMAYQAMRDRYTVVLPKEPLVEAAAAAAPGSEASNPGAAAPQAASPATSTPTLPASSEPALGGM